MPFCIGWAENFDEIALSVKEIEANFCFSIFGKNSKIQNGRHMWEEEIFLKGTLAQIPWGSKFRRNRSFRTVEEIEANMCFSIFGKYSKIQNGHHFWAE